MGIKATNSQPTFALGFVRWSRRRFFKRPLISILVAVLAVLTSVLVRQVLVSALSKAWVQSDWSGGANTNTSADDTSLTTWTEYYSGTNVDHSTSGELKLQRELSTP